MKVIDLLNKIANGETPNKIIYLPYATNNEYAGKYSYEQGDYLKDGWSNMWLFKDHLKAKLNNEVEIIEEDKKIKYVPTYVLCDSDFETKTDYSKKAVEIIDKAFEQYSDAINELIDEVNKLKKGK